MRTVERVHVVHVGSGASVRTEKQPTATETVQPAGARPPCWSTVCTVEFPHVFSLCKFPLKDIKMSILQRHIVTIRRYYSNSLAPTWPTWRLNCV